MSDDRPLDRRRFFRIGLRELFKPLANAAEPIERALRELESLDKVISSTPPATPSPSRSLPVFLRPPGALDEQAFREQCSRCGICVSVCPADAIKIDSTGAIANGAPYIVAAEAPCVACDGLHCMQNCPSGALTFRPLVDIDMGTAQWKPHFCTRTTIGDACRICVDQCPLGSAALVIDDGGHVKVIEDGCIGCGVCEHYCPTEPKSIVVVPKLQLSAGTVARE
jgi:MauM/NapG family ferredoxin protein